MHTPDLFRGCVASSGNQTATQTCIMIPKQELRPYLTYYTMLTEVVLQRSCNQLDKKFLNTAYKITRAAIEYRGHMGVGVTFRMEFTTIRSICLHPRGYSFYMCPPVDNKVNGICQALFFIHRGAFILERSWCKHTG
ncbi:hypothetical protein MTO96_039957 [Rhipicephalus appendiculatus]